MGQADPEHPTQGRPFDGKLEAQPPSQLLTPRSILRSFSSTDSSPAGGDVPRDTVRLTVLRVTARCCGLCDLATGFGAWTVMLGRAVASERGSVRDIAVPLSNTVDRTARAEGATRLDDILITRCGRKLRMQNVRPHAIHSQSEAHDLLVGEGTQGGPLVFPNDTRKAQDSLFRVACLTRSSRKESGIGFPFRPIDLRTIARSKQLRWLPDASFRGSVPAPVSISDVLVA